MSMQLEQEEEDDEDLEAEDSLVHLPLSDSTALRVNNNMLTSWDGFWPTMCDLFTDPAANVQWLDLSFNDIRSIESASTVLYDQDIRQDNLLK